MVTRRQIQGYALRVARQFKPQRIILFESYAYGKPTTDSDVDLLVVMRHRKRRNVEQAIAISGTVGAPFPMDLLVRTSLGLEPPAGGQQELRLREKKAAYRAKRRRKAGHR